MKVTEEMEEKLYDSKYHLDEAKEVLVSALYGGEDESISAKQVAQVRESLKRTVGNIEELKALLDKAITEGL